MCEASITNYIYWSSLYEFGSVCPYNIIISLTKCKKVSPGSLGARVWSGASKSVSRCSSVLTSGECKKFKIDSIATGKLGWVFPQFNLHSQNNKVSIIGPWYLQEFWVKSRKQPLSWLSKPPIMTNFETKTSTVLFRKMSWGHFLLVVSGFRFSKLYSCRVGRFLQNQKEK